MIQLEFRESRFCATRALNHRQQAACLVWNDGRSYPTSAASRWCLNLHWPVRESSSHLAWMRMDFI